MGGEASKDDAFQAEISAMKKKIESQEAKLEKVKQAQSAPAPAAPTPTPTQRMLSLAAESAFGV